MIRQIELLNGVVVKSKGCWYIQGERGDVYVCEEGVRPELCILFTTL